MLTVLTAYQATDEMDPDPGVRLMSIHWAETPESAREDGSHGSAASRLLTSRLSEWRRDMTQFDDEVEKVLLSLLIEEGYLKEGDRKNPKAILAAHESWMADIRTKREDEEAARRPS